MANREIFQVGEWVAAIWSEVWWVGVVEEVMECDEYAIKFMHPVEDSKHADILIDWPEVEDITAIPHGDIVCAVSKPVGSVYKSTMCFSLPEKEITAINDRFDKML